LSKRQGSEDKAPGTILHGEGCGGVAYVKALQSATINQIEKMRIAEAHSVTIQPKAAMIFVRITSGA
jgi:hypothetical protein